MTGDNKDFQPPASTGVPAQAAAAPAPLLADGMSRFKGLLQGNTLVPLLIAGAAAIALMAAMVMWANNPGYRVLFNNLGGADGGRIISELESRGIPYQFSEGGQALLVPADQVHVLRLQLAELGLPENGNVGFELLDNQAFGISQFAEQTNFQRGLEGELARSIESMNPVSTARVHLSLPKPSVFVRDREPAKASVVITLASGRALGQSQVNAIRHLVSSSVANLAIDDVTVVDHAGNLLSDIGEKDPLDGDELRYIEEVQRRYQSNIESILQPLFGERNVRVQVAADLDFSVREETQERYAPNQDLNQAAIRSAQLSGAMNGPEEALADGIPGALSNTPPGWIPAPVEQLAQAGGNAGAAGAAASESLRYDNVVNYEVDRNVLHIQHTPGKVERLTVATAVNYRDGVDEEGNAVQIPLSAAELQQITGLVRQAMGFSDARGDQLEVVNFPFFPDYDQPAPQPSWWRTPQAQELIITFSRYLFVALFALALYLLILRPLLRRHLEQPVAVTSLPAPVADEPEGIEGTLEPLPIKTEQRRKRERKDTSYEQDLREVRQLAQEDPRLMAMVVRSWMNKNG